MRMVCQIVHLTATTNNQRLQFFFTSSLMFTIQGAVTRHHANFLSPARVGESVTFIP